MTNNDTKLILLLFKLYKKLQDEDFTVVNGTKTVELLGMNEHFDPRTPFFNLHNVKKSNEEYIKKELEWYESQSLSVEEIGKHAKIWKLVSSINGLINSNYGTLILSDENHNQYSSALNTLITDKESRQSVMIYNRPTMHTDWNKDGMHDFICTMYTQQFIRDNELYMIYNMRSNDAVFGFFNDFAWASHVYMKFLNDYNKATNSNVKVGNVQWFAGSFHIYERHFDLLRKIMLEHK